MKAKIHPQWFDNCMVTCACGNVFTIGSTKSEIRTDICSKCHPFFTGEMKFVDAMGRVEKFQAKQKYAATQAQVIADKRKKKKDKQESLRNQKSLKEMLANLR